MKKLLIKYLNDSLSEAEKLQLIKWLQSPTNQKTFKEFVIINHRLHKKYTPIDGEQAKQELLAQIQMPTSLDDAKTRSIEN